MELGFRLCHYTRFLGGVARCAAVADTQCLEVKVGRLTQIDKALLAGNAIRVTARSE